MNKREERYTVNERNAETSHKEYMYFDIITKELSVINENSRI